MHQNAEPLMTVRDLSLTFDGSQPILSHVSLSLNRGELVVVAGPNGSGKSMLMRCLKGRVAQSAGNILLGERDVSKLPKERNRAVGLVFQDVDTQVVGQTVRRDILFGLENLELPLTERTTRCDQALQRLGLEEVAHRRPRTLSGGERRRLAIAGVLAMQPHLLILDEPFANLDYPGVVQVLQALVALHQGGQTVVVVTHEIEKLLAHADALVLMNGGTVVAQGHPEEVLPLVESAGVRRPRHRDEPLELKELTWLK